MARYFKDSKQILRFIEFMDVGTTNGWNLEQVVSGQEIVERISEHFELEPLDPKYRGEVAKRWRYVDGGNEFGLITSVTEAFCGDCSRVRLSAKGSVYSCLFASRGTDLRHLLRGGANDEVVNAVIADMWKVRSDRYSEIRGAGESTAEEHVLEKVEMSYIGG